VFYAPADNTDTEPAMIASTAATIVDGSAIFEVAASDPGGAVEQVVVLFTDAANPRFWTPVDLVVGDTPNTFVGAAAVADGVTEVDYFVQVVDSGGNVAVSSNKGEYYSGTEYVAPPPPPTAPSIVVGEVSNGSATVTVTPGTGGSPVSIRVDGGEPTTVSPVVVTGGGIHTVTATGPNGATATVSIVIPVAQLPTIQSTVTPADTINGWHREAPTVVVTGTGISGIETSVDGGAFTAGHTVGPIVKQGQTSVVYRGATSPGHVVGSRTVRFDDIGPVVTCPSPTPIFIVNQPGGELTATVSDATSGVATPTITVPVATTSAGSFTVQIAATDVAGNSTTTLCPVDVTYVAAGFTSPVDTGEGVVNTAKAGSNVPLKWRLTDYNGVPISDTSSFVGISAIYQSCDNMTSTTDVVQIDTTSGLKYQGDGNWQFNWKSSKGLKGCLLLSLNLKGSNGAIAAHFWFK
jgi:hypothetical protein